MRRSLILAAGTGPLTWLIKLSLFSLIYHVFNPLAYVRILALVGIVLSASYYITSTVINVYYCGPQGGGTDRLSYLAGLASLTCGDPAGVIQIFSPTTGVVNLVVDIYLLAIPLAAISHLNLPRKRKMGVFFIFFSGAGACVMSSLTLYYRTLGFSHSSSSDTTYQIVSVLTVSSTVEYTVGVIIPCMAPSAKAWNHTSVHITSYMRSRFGGFNTMDDAHSILHYRQMRSGARGHELPSSMNTVDVMLLQIDPRSLKDQTEVESTQSS
ncbi:hypothetical protein EAF00_006951 [Botryotinia globosa]|nr:hypothetical protein EAF00_006951 [Botryotinia globosa]